MEMNIAWNFSTLAINAVMFKFHGTTAHAAADPFNGRSALDAVELMNVGVNYLREHVIPDARMHYVITNGGGAPNVVPAYAEVYYFIRAPKRKQVEEVYQRVVKVAKGAAMMTETDLEIDFHSGTYNTAENAVVRDTIQKNMEAVGPVTWTDEELEFAKEMRKSIPESAFEAMLKIVPEEFKEQAKALFKKPLCDVVMPNLGKGETMPGSTDVADVSWVLPLAQFSTATAILGSPGHSWQNVACARMSIGHKGMLMAAKILATTAADFMMDGELVSKAKAEFEEDRKEEKYKSPFPEDHKPPHHRLKEDILQYP
jgi:aminobenzoyl-glutamate utilization protein B